MATIDVGTNTPPAMGPDPGRRTVLVVDDSADTRALLRDVLAREHCLVLTAASGEAALRTMARQRPDLVITDLFMSGMSGFTLRASMLQKPDLAAIPVIVLTAYWQRPGETLDAVAVLAKPVNLDRLVAVVRDVIRPAATE